MKNKFTLLLLAASMTCASCATVFGGQKTDHQNTKPECGQPRRQLRPVALVFGVIFPPSLVIDFATEKIYKPQPRENRVKKCRTNE